MLIKIKNKDTLIFDEFKLKCSIGKAGIKKNKIEGDKSTPKGIYKLGKLYWRADRVEKPITKLLTKKINKKMGWCNDSRSKFYNKEILINKNIKHEKLMRKDFKYNYFILIKYNYTKVKKNVGSAIFIHLTKNYKKTSGCIALSEKDFLILAKIVNKNTLIKIY
tara:strand:- start:281 stop:772 length:492 start_codon:yes stop_codon:yes gene_type:complete